MSSVSHIIRGPAMISKVLKGLQTGVLAAATLAILGSGAAHANILSFIETETATINFTGVPAQNEGGDPYIPYTLTFNKFDPFLYGANPYASRLLDVTFLYSVNSSNVVITITNTHPVQTKNVRVTFGLVQAFANDAEPADVFAAGAAPEVVNTGSIPWFTTLPDPFPIGDQSYGTAVIASGNIASYIGAGDQYHLTDSAVFVPSSLGN